MTKDEAIDAIVEAVHGFREDTPRSVLRAEVAPLVARLREVDWAEMTPAEVLAALKTAPAVAGEWQMDGEDWIRPHLSSESDWAPDSYTYAHTVSAARVTEVRVTKRDVVRVDADTSTTTTRIVSRRYETRPAIDGNRHFSGRDWFAKFDRLEDAMCAMDARLRGMGYVLLGRVHEAESPTPAAPSSKHT